MSDRHANAEPLLPHECLPDDVATLQGMVRELLASLRQQQHDNEALRHRLDLLLRRLYGRRSERLDPGQLLLFATADAATTTVAASPCEAAAASPRRRSRPQRRVRCCRLPRDCPVPVCWPT